MKAPSKHGDIAGFLLVELTCALAILMIGLMSLGLVMVSMSRQQEHSRVRRLVLAEMQGILEEIRAVSPQSIPAAYQGRTYVVPGVTGTNPDGTTITATVDDTNPRHLLINLTAGWSVVGQDSTLRLNLEVYAPKSSILCN